MFVRFKVFNYNKQWITAKNWYLVGNTKQDTNNLEEELNWDINDKLKTVYYDNQQVKRIRELEPHIHDARWSLKQSNEAVWTMNNKYIKHTLLSKDSTNRSLDLELFANMLVFDHKKVVRVISEDNKIKVKVDFEKLIKEPFKHSGAFSEIVDNKQININYLLTISYDENNNINFSFKIDSPYGIKLGLPQNQYPNGDSMFDQNRAVIMPYVSMKISMSYTNSIQNESDFGLGQTNLYDYNKVNTSAKDDVHLLYNDASYYANKTIYNPNQNVYWKHHDGFIPDVQWIRDDWGTTNRDWELINKVRDNSFKYVTRVGGHGSGGFVAKVNDDPSDLSLYYISNYHVGKFAANNNANDNGVYPKNSKEALEIHGGDWLWFGLALNKWDSWLYNGYKFNQFDNTTPLQFTDSREKEKWTKLLYVGNNRSSNYNHSSVNELVNKQGNASNSSYDIQLTHSTYDEALMDAKMNFKSDLIKKFENLLNQKPTKMNQSIDHYNNVVPVLNPFAHIGFPNWGFMTGYVDFRPKILDEKFSFEQYPNYSPMKFGQGNSGTAVWAGDGDYVATWRGGNRGSESFGYFYDNQTNNFFGINWENENPIDSKSFKNSVGHMILRQALNHPFKYSVPWFYKAIKK
ncbi:MGA_1079 family surface serine endopeptidase [Ureaplasma diversum]|uniref:MGA_1079 family surface serine endopeptidase n=1 Tax=Ureaplasma diversum TaxID=42094 RepID=UPI0005709333|nr:hypothetical protein [Ureaplasma diversum]